jgi:hypothetical protein
LLAVGTRFATDITFNVISVFVLAYGTQQLGLSRSLLLTGILVGSVVALFTPPCSTGCPTASAGAPSSVRCRVRRDLRVIPPGM